jgi:hypothetical protein
MTNKAPSTKTKTTMAIYRMVLYKLASEFEIGEDGLRKEGDA